VVAILIQADKVGGLDPISSEAPGSKMRNPLAESIHFGKPLLGDGLMAIMKICLWLGP